MGIFEDTLVQLEETKDKFWNISHKTGDFIEKTIVENGLKSALECGTSNGYSGLRILHALKQTGGHLITIEYWEKRLVIAKENFEKCGYKDGVDIIQGKCFDVINEQLSDKKFDFVFLDANKGGYLEVYEAVLPLLTDNAILLADDIYTHSEEVKPFVEAIKQNNNFDVEILDLPDGVLFARKKNG